MLRTVSVFLVVVALAAGGGYWLYHANGNQPTAFRTAKVERGYLRAAIGATGTIEPEEVIDVGAQVAGRIDRFGVDPRSRDLQNALLLLSGLPRLGNPVALALARVVPLKGIDYSSP